jgi:four helix bundle protein
MEKPHRKLIAWQKSMDLATLVYQMTEDFPRTEQCGLSSQMRRAAVSIPSNLAEGAARKSLKEFEQFLHIARGSLSELDTQMEVACRVGYLKETERVLLDSLLPEIDRLLSGLIKKQRQI